MQLAVSARASGNAAEFCRFKWQHVASDLKIPMA
jgi:hypothetical protein